MAFEVVDKKTQFAVLGLGIFGMQVALSLIKEGEEVVVADKEKALVDQIKERALYAYELDSTNEDALIEAGIDTVDCAIVCIGVDMMASILTTLILKKFNIPRIVARAYSQEHAQILELIGITEVVQPEMETSLKLAQRLIGHTGFFLSYDEIWKDHAIVEIRVDHRLAGKSLLELNFRNAYKVNVVAIKRVTERLDDQFRNIVDQEINEVPDPKVPLEQGQILILLGTKKNIRSLNAALTKEIL